MKSGGTLKRITGGLTVLLLVIAVLSWAAYQLDLPVRNQIIIAFFLLSFGGFTVFMAGWALSLSGSADEKGKGRKAIGGLVGHFAGSMAILLLYFFAFYQRSLFEVWTALITYVVSFVVFTYLLTRMR